MPDRLVSMGPCQQFRKGGPHDLIAPIAGYYFCKDAGIGPAGREITISWLSTRHGVDGRSHEGEGLVGHLLTDARIHADKVTIPTVVSARLEGMLRRRGFEPRLVVFDDDPDEELIESYVWLLAPER